MTRDTNLDEILGFWFGEPAFSADALRAKMRRWFGSGEILDGPIRKLFGATVERALRGELDGWAGTLRGRLALVVVLDQLNRHVNRGTPRQHAGDAAALVLAREALLERRYHGLHLEEKLFLFMPFPHAEDVEAQRVSVALAHSYVDEASAELRPVWEAGRDRALFYQSIIERFGRFPSRNEALGRASTREELVFLAEQAEADRAMVARLQPETASRR